MWAEPFLNFTALMRESARKKEQPAPQIFGRLRTAFKTESLRGAYPIFGPILGKLSKISWADQAKCRIDPFTIAFQIRRHMRSLNRYF